MHLVYIDESGNTGNDLASAAQPVFVLGALLVPEEKWLPLEEDLLTSTRNFLGSGADLPEIHATELSTGRGIFRSIPKEQRTAFRESWVALLGKHHLRFFYRAIVKKRYLRWLQDSFGPGVIINPHVAAFALVARVVNEYLRQQRPAAQGILISDEQKEVVKDVEKSIRSLRVAEGVLRLDRVIEKGFFIDSRTSIPLQLADLCCYLARKREEAKAGLKVRPADATTARLLDPHIYRGNEALGDVIAWLTAEKKKGGQGT